MPEDKNQDTSTQQNSGLKEQQGRIDNSQNSAIEKQDAGNDISRVDQQEGDMNNGESGGNFTQQNKQS